MFVSDNGYFFGEHGLGPERRFAYEDGIRSPLLVRYPPLVRPGTTIDALTLALDIAPTVIDVAGGTPGPHIQGRSLVPLLRGERPAWRSSFLAEYYGEAAIPWLVSMSYKAVRTERHKYIDWTQHPGADELYDLAADPYELTNLAREPGRAALRQSCAASCGGWSPSRSGCSRRRRPHFSRGSSTSRSAFPSRFSPSTVTRIARPGKFTSHGARTR